MKFTPKQKRLLINFLLITAVILSVIGIYFGLRFFLATDAPLVVVASGSMYPALEVGDLIIIQGVNVTNIKVGDIIVFNQDGQSAYTIHRVKEIQTFPDGTLQFITKGDANNSTDAKPVPKHHVKGCVLYRLPLLGYVALDPTIPIILIITVVTILLLWPEKSKRHSRTP